MSAMNVALTSASDTAAPSSSSLGFGARSNGP